MITYIARRLAFTFIIGPVLLHADAAAAQTSVFTYQGRLNNGGSTASGSTT